VARGGGPGLTSETRDQLAELIGYYQQLIGHYQSIAEFGQDEVILIDQGDMEALMTILCDKEKIMAEVAKCQEKIGAIQDTFVNRYQLESFSLNKLKAVVDSSNRDLLEKLRKVIKQLIKELEILEQQEKIHESMLKSFAEEVQKKQARKQAKAGAKAYEKIIEPKPDNDIDLKR
jgi:CHAD domain-containing protein